jgi:hypothetical protein
LTGEWSTERSLDTIQRKLAIQEVSAAGGPDGRVKTFGWSDLESKRRALGQQEEEEVENLVGNRKKVVPNNYIHQELISLAEMKKYCYDKERMIPSYIKPLVSLQGWPDAYWIRATTLEPSELPTSYPSFTSFWQTVRVRSPLDLILPKYPLQRLSYHYLENSPHFGEFLDLPDLNNKALDQQPYLAGIGNNRHDESIAAVVDHPLRHVLSCLPQCLAIGGALGYWDEDQQNGAPEKEPREYLQKARDAADGTVRPWSYAGSYLTIFAVHREDAQLPSANLHLGGASKVWIGLTEQSMRMLQEKVDVPIAECHTYHRAVFYHPSFLIRHNIPFNVAIQQPGDLILSDSEGAHQGWNSGNNCAMACNYLDAPSILDIKANMFHEVNPNWGRWHCLCKKGTRPYLPTIPINAAKKVRLEEPWFDIVHGVDRGGKSNVGNAGVLLKWVQNVDQILSEPEQEEPGKPQPRDLACYEIWCRAYLPVLGH